MQGKEDSSVQGVLLVNLGTPDSPSVADVRSYLKEFLWDPRVVKMARFPWWLMLNLVILNTRPKHTAAAYAKVWTAEGSPLLVISRRQQQALQEKFDRQGGGTIKV
ncbi:MAG: ferrochelatase, partial [Gammaproteobacteria bacterium]|nr:ferrochelatase [Gammaproteobacteria bacterium]